MRVRRKRFFCVVNHLEGEWIYDFGVKVGDLIMPREDRRIIFTYAETYKALYALCMQKEMRRPPPGSIVAITIDGDDDKKLTVRIENMQENTEHEVDYSRDFMAAALMLYCRSLSIPISKKASKSVEFKSEGVVLRLVI